MCGRTSKSALFLGARRARSSYGGPTFRAVVRAMRATGPLWTPSGAETGSLSHIRVRKSHASRPAAEVQTAVVGLQVGVVRGGRDRRQRHADGDGRDAETMP